MRARQRGFTYVVVLVAAVVIGILAEAAHLTTSRQQRAEREVELLFRGDAYRRAVESYVRRHGNYPRALDELRKDSRDPTRRHMRALYRDPMAARDQTADTETWTLLRAPDGGISGVASRSRETPLKQAGFAPGYEHLEGAATYAEWLFEYRPQAGAPAAAAGRKVPAAPHTGAPPGKPT